MPECTGVATRERKASTSDAESGGSVWLDMHQHGPDLFKVDEGPRGAADRRARGVRSAVALRRHFGEVTGTTPSRTGRCSVEREPATGRRYRKWRPDNVPGERRTAGATSASGTFALLRAESGTILEVDRLDE